MEPKRLLKRRLQKADEKINKIKDEQIRLVHDYITENYKLEIGDKIMVKGFVEVIVGFDFEELTYFIRIRYRRTKPNGTLDNVVYKTIYKPNLERLGKWHGSLN